MSSGPVGSEQSAASSEASRRAWGTIASREGRQDGVSLGVSQLCTDVG